MNHDDIVGAFGLVPGKFYIFALGRTRQSEMVAEQERVRNTNLGDSGCVDRKGEGALDGERNKERDSKECGEHLKGRCG